MLRLESDALTVSLSPQGAGLSGAMRDGRVFLGPQPCFPLVPLGNRVEDNSFALDGHEFRFQPNTAEPLYLHGDGWLAKWQVISATTTSARLTLDQTQPTASPQIYHAEMAVVLEGAALSVSLSVTNHGAQIMPFGLGLHPFFPRKTATRITAPAQAYWSEGGGYLPHKRGPIPASADFNTPAPLPPHRLNNAYEGWSGQARVDWPDARLRLDITADPIFAHLMVYAPEDDASFFCLEPMTHLPNALALLGPRALHLLSPGETLSGSITFRLSDME
ncbi:MAG: aldose 1-epimerase [Pseudomonadota bacterium]